MRSRLRQEEALNFWDGRVLLMRLSCPSKCYLLALLLYHGHVLLKALLRAY